MNLFYKFKLSRWFTITVLGVLFSIPVLVVWFLWNIGNNAGYAPTQPIPFSHKLHAGDLKIDCQYCHTGTDKSRVASVPSMQTCMNCHSLVKADSPHIQKMKDLIAKGESFEWVRVHDMPDFVYFNHRRHIAKGIDCKECHGDVRSMPVITQEINLTMGFCIDCHRKKEASIECNACHN
ncbi:MAG: cytochrome c3 family protein [Deltaproteobacteria bacterium]|nr:cytochrome c3 family protein [Deltaproteobacteria bacterium]